MKINLRDIKKAAAAVLIAAAAVILTSVLFSTSVSASINISVDYVGETIILSGLEESEKPVTYMYSPKVSEKLDPATAGSADRTRLAAEKWYPVYGNEIDISKLIPRSGQIYIAFRDAGELPDIHGVYYSRRVSAAISSRPALPSNTKSHVKYSPSTESIVTGGIFGEDGAAYEYRVGISQWVRAAGATIDASSKYNSMGGVVSIRSAATNSSFASAEYKVKIPKSPAPPKVRVNGGRIIGINTKNHRWAAAENGPYYSFNFSSIILKNFPEQMKVNDTLTYAGAFAEPRISIDGVEHIAMYIKIPATDKKPSSMAQRLWVPVNEIPGASNEPAEPVI
ncbi:MAG: hypothetical protein FWH10_06690 [Oscillospiraceae bacterium]|nr:hypothetical protein [Oscillospiraceae bacterium]